MKKVGGIARRFHILRLRINIKSKFGWPGCFAGVLILVVSLALVADAYAAENWCIENPENPPCGGAPGRCFKNSDGSQGGFVADTATLDKKVDFWTRQRYLPYVDKFAQICDRARVLGDVKILDRATISGNSQIIEHAQVYGDAKIAGAARISGRAQIYGNARVYENAQVSGVALVSGNGQVYGNARVTHDSRVYGDAQVMGDARLRDHVRVFGSSRVFGDARIRDRVQITGSAQVYEHARIEGNQIVSGRVTNRHFTQTNSSSNFLNLDLGLDLESFLKQFDPQNKSEKENRPVAIFRQFLESEADVLRQSHATRMQTRLWPDFVCLNQLKIGIDAKDVPDAQSKTYIIRDSILAAKTGHCIGDALTQNQIESHPAIQSLLDALTDPDLIRIESSSLSPAYQARGMNQQEEAYMNDLRTQIRVRLETLNQAQGGFYQNPMQLYGSLFLYGFKGKEDEEIKGIYHRDKFQDLLDSIQSNDEKKFIDNLIRLSTLFNSRHAEARSAFIDTFTHLFVTKNFPSEGIRQQYYHFILRCGQIH